MPTSYVTEYSKNEDSVRNLDIPCTIKKVAAYDESAMFLTTDGRVYVFGQNISYQLGLPNESEHIITPKELPITNVADVSTSNRKTLVLTSDNILYGVGVNSYRALSFPSSESKIKELTQIQPLHYNHEKIVATAPAYSFSVVATEQSNLYVFGQNWLDPKNDGSRASWLFECPEICSGGKKIVDMRCGSFHVGILNSAGEVFLGGDPDFGKLGFQTDKYYGMKKFVSEHIFCAISMAGDSSYLAASNGTLFAFGHQRGLFDDDSAEEEYKVLQFPSVEQISAQNKDIVVCTAQGEVYLNVECQATSLLCNYDASYNVISQKLCFETIATVDTCNAQNRVVGSPCTNCHLIVTSNKMPPQTSYVTRYTKNEENPTNLDFPCTIKKVSAYDDSALFLTTDGRVFALGVNVNYHLGLLTEDALISTPTELPISDIADVSTSDRKTLLLTNNNILYGVGVNDYTALGLLGGGRVISEITQIPFENYNNERIVVTAPAYSFSVVATEKSNLFVFGQNWMDPDDSDSRASRLYECPEICKGGKTIVDMRCGSFHIGLINSAGEVFLGGDADSGKLGFQTAKYYGMKKFISEHIFSTIAVVSDVTILGSLDGTLIAFGQRSGLLDYEEEDYDEKLYSHTVLQFPSIEQVSAQGGEVVVCTTQGEVYITNLKERRVLGTYSTAYNAISQCIIDHTYVCLSDKRNGVLDIFLLMPRTMHRKELHDITILH